MLILDAPPVMGLADAPLIASVATGVLMAIEVGHTTRGHAQAAIRRLRMANARLLGVVLTKFDTRKSAYGYGYAYSYEYDYQYGMRDRDRPRSGQTPKLTRERARTNPPAA
ncbi:MAG: hypothetical protein WDM85_18160 [Caulobacteraceae bacterium]